MTTRFCYPTEVPPLPSPIGHTYRYLGVGQKWFRCECGLYCESWREIHQHLRAAAIAQDLAEGIPL